MKTIKLISVLLCVVLCFNVLCGCTKDEPAQDNQTENEVTSLPISQPLEFGHSSGAGAWYTSLTLKPDGTFSGTFHDSEMGSIGEGYPKGTVYTSEFTGKFSEIEKVNDYTYTMAMVELTVPDEGKEWIEDEMLNIVSRPAGLDGKVFTLYTPDAPISELSEDFLNWKQTDSDGDSNLLVYGLYNQSTGAGFFTFE